MIIAIIVTRRGKNLYLFYFIIIFLEMDRMIKKYFLVYVGDVNFFLYTYGGKIISVNIILKTRFQATCCKNWEGIWLNFVRTTLAALINLSKSKVTLLGQAKDFIIRWVYKNLNLNFLIILFVLKNKNSRSKIEIPRMNN